MRSFIFDFNGTLFWDGDLHRRAWRRFMADHGRPISDEEYWRNMNGPGNDVILRRYFGSALSDDQADAMSEEKEAIYRQLVLSDPSLQALAPGAQEMLDTLRRRGVPCCVATASIRANVDFYMETLGLRRWFDDAHMFYMTGEFPGKPDPAIYRLAMARLGYDPAQTVVVEDSLPGLRAAAAAGVGSLIVIGGLGPDALGEFPNIRAIIPDFYGFDRFLDA